MKNFRYITSEQVIASYMAGFNQNKMTYEDYYNWSEYLYKKLNVDDYQTIVFYGKEYLKKLEREDDGFLFDFGDMNISLAKNRTKKDLDKHILSFVDGEILLLLLGLIELYKDQSNEEIFME